MFDDGRDGARTLWCCSDKAVGWNFNIVLELVKLQQKRKDGMNLEEVR